MQITEIFEDVPDFRVVGRTSYKLSEILIISLCAVLGGAEDCEEISEYGRQKEAFLRTFLELAHGIPSHDTFTRVFRFLDQEAFSACLYRWSEEIVASINGLQINIDGKALRATGKRGKRTSGLCLVNAWVANRCLSLGQVKVDAKSNEKTAIPTIIEDIDIAGALVSIDAMGTHSKFAQQIRSKGGDYLLALRKNQKGLYEQVSDWLERHQEALEIYTDTDYVGGRIETRTTWVCRDLRWLNALDEWPGCSSIIMTRYERSFKNGKTDSTSKTRLYISSAKYQAQQFNTAVRSHWSIENPLHWYLDVVFMEDKQRVREGNGPENMATLRKLSLQLIMQQKTKGMSVKKLRKRAAWNDEFLLKTIFQMANLF